MKINIKNGEFKPIRSMEKSKLLAWRLSFNILTVIESMDLTQHSLTLDENADVI